GEPGAGRLSVFFRRIDGSYQRVTVPVDGAYSKLAIGNFDADGGRDLAALVEDAPRHLSPFLQAGRQFTAVATVPVDVTDATEQLAGAGDVDGDGMDELLLQARRRFLPEGGQVTVLRATGAGAFERAVSVDYRGN